MAANKIDILQCKIFKIKPYADNNISPGNDTFHVIESGLGKNKDCLSVRNDKVHSHKISCAFDAMGMDMMIIMFGMVWRTKAHYDEISIIPENEYFNTKK